MEIRIITSEFLPAVSWSGGTTTELFIFPQTSDYKLRDFQFRLSSATVETDRSEFTSLPGISRKLMVLEGKITLNHANHYSRQLNKFDIDEFEGDWKTSSEGKCIDFNLMTTGKTSGELSAVVIEKEQNFNRKINESCDLFFIYIFSGKIKTAISNNIAITNKGDFLVLNKMAERDIDITGIEKSELVFVEIFLH